MPHPNLPNKNRTKRQSRFAVNPAPELPRSTFDRSHGHKTTIDAGKLYPIILDMDVLPGDTLTLRPTVVARFATLVKPIMDAVYVDVQVFAVPWRLLWDNFPAFCGAQENPTDDTDFMIPQVQAPVGGFQEGSMADYFGLPTKVENLSVSALPFRASNLVWNEWYRAGELQDKLPVPKGDGPDTAGDFKINPRNKRHDYFTSALVSPQRGDAVDLPLGLSAPVIPETQGASWPHFEAPSMGNEQYRLRVRNGITDTHWDKNGGASDEPVVWGDQTGLMADLTNATAATVNSLREAFQFQKVLERDARGGTRLTEVYEAHFKIQNPDMRLQRPEYVGGFSQRMAVQAVAATSDIGAGSGARVGDLGAFGQLVSNGGGFRYSATEHTILIGFISVRSDLNYQQGIERGWSRRRREDLYWPSYAHLGEDFITNKEIFAQGTVDDDLPWGFQERWADYRYKPSRVTSRMRSNATSPVDVWHLSQTFQSLPVLGDTFIQDTPPIDRVVAITDEPAFVVDAWYEYNCARPMPTYSIPGFIDRF